MSRYEYKVVPAPRKAVKIRGARSVEDRFAMGIQAVLNTHGADGWEYMRAESLPSEEREGLMSKTTVFQNMLIFRRVLTVDVVTPETRTTTSVLIADHSVPAATVAVDHVTVEKASEDPVEGHADAAPTASPPKA